MQTLAFEICLDHSGSDGILYFTLDFFAVIYRTMASRKMRRSRMRKHSRKHSRKHRGGMAPLGDSSMAAAQRQSLTQGSQYLNMHKAQHGGSAAYPASFGATLPSSMVAAARTGPLDSANAAIQGMQDGGRRRKSRKSRKARKSRKSRKARKSRKSRKSRKHSKKSRKHRGGYRGLAGASLSANSMLLPPGAERQAALSHEWGLAKDVNAFAPKA